MPFVIFGHHGREGHCYLVSFLHDQCLPMSRFAACLYIGLFSLGFGPGLTAQTAPDFTVTDIVGTDHTLYTDYLDAGRVMVLALFYDGAPAVGELYPALQAYAIQEWSAGTPVSFMLMSNVDSNEALQNFVTSHGLQLPVVGAEGGAPGATDVYINGTFGMFYGYPMFVIIGPDGDVIYDPWHSDIQTMIAMIDETVKMLLGVPISVNELAGSQHHVRAINNVLHIDLGAAARSGHFVLTLYDLTGRMQLQRIIAEESKVVIATNLPPGIFVYALEGGDVPLSGKLLLH